MLDARKKEKSGKNLEKKNQATSSRNQESGKNCKKKRTTQEYKNTRILPGETFLGSSDKLLSTRIPQECSDLVFQVRILHRREWQKNLV